MSLRLPDKYLWDFWFIRRGDDYHLFYLQAPRTPHNPELRHEQASIGHAVSTDLMHWTVLPDALHAGPPGAWDDTSIWTGSVVERGGTYYLFYTSRSRAEQGKIQRIGLALSGDLIHWERHPANPLMEADPRWYEKLSDAAWPDEAWRDPEVVFDRDSGLYYAYVCARANHGPADGRGVIGLARSGDLIQWEALPPVTEPGEFGYMEVPQLVRMGGRYYLLFCTQASVHSAARTRRLGAEPMTGTHYLVADSPLGPFRYSTDAFMVGDRRGSLYAGKLVPDARGEWRFLAWRHSTPDGTFLGELSDPFPARVDLDGNLVVDWSS